MANTVRKLADDLMKVENRIVSIKSLIALIRRLNQVRSDPRFTEALRVLGDALGSLLQVRGEVIDELDESGADTFQAKLPFSALMRAASALIVAAGFTTLTVTALNFSRASVKRADALLKAVEKDRQDIPPEVWTDVNKTFSEALGGGLGKFAPLAVAALAGLWVLSR